MRLDSPAHAITEDEFHVCVFLGREGLWATLNGRMLNNGEKDPRHWYGWDHRVRGFRGFNDSPIRIGKSASGKQSNIVVAQFAVFVTGKYAKRLKLADAQALAQESGDPLGHPLFDKSTENVAVGGDIQAAIDARRRRAAVGRTRFRYAHQKRRSRHEERGTAQGRRGRQDHAEPDQRRSAQRWFHGQADAQGPDVPGRTHREAEQPLDRQFPDRTTPS